VRTLAGAGVTVLMTSHLLADVEDVCDRVAILDCGALCAEGRTDDLLRQPDAVRFEIEGMDDAAAREARSALETRFGRPVRQSYPSLTLERYFLQVVADGRTSDAFRLAPFLLGPQPDPEPSGGAPCATA